MPYQTLKNVTVVECGDLVAAPYCTKLLAEFGARVIKVFDTSKEHRALKESEAIEFDGKKISALYCYTNANKQVIALDLSQEKGKTILYELIQKADILVENLPVAELQDLGLEEREVKQLNPQVVHVSISPFGRSGPYAQWAGEEINAVALSGFASVVGFPNREPLTLPYGIGSYQGAVHGASAAILGLINRRRTGRGNFIDISIADVLASYTRMYGLLYQFYDIKVIRDGRRAPGSGGRYPMTILPCKDGYVVLIGRMQKDWESYIEMMGHPGWADEPRYKDTIGIALEYPDEVDNLIIPWLKQYTRAELMEMAEKNKLPMAPVRSVDEVMADEQFAFRNFFTRFTLADRQFQMPTLPYQFTNFPEAGGVELHFPGQDTVLVLQEILGYNAEEINGLLVAGVVSVH